MAPRRIKKGLTRMDAALEHMSLMGFSKQHVRKTVKDLLKVYGGDGAWSLIEEDGYRVLIEVLLTEQEAGGSQNQTENSMDASSQNENSGRELRVESSSGVGAEPTSPERITDRLLTGDKGTEANAVGIQDPVSPCPLGPPSDVAQTRNDVPPRRRKPCYGWISDGEDEEESHFIILKPANLKAAFSNSRSL